MNLLIASIVDVKQHRDAAKYASECISLIELVKSQGFQVNKKYLDELSTIAHKVRDKIEKRVSELRDKEPRAAALGQPLALEYLGAKLVRDLRDEFGESALGQMTWKERQPLLIEGMYTVAASDVDLAAATDDVARVGEQLDNFVLGETSNKTDSNPLNLPTGNPNLPTPLQKVAKQVPKEHGTI